MPSSGPSADDARRNGYRNTRIERRHGCVVGTTTAFLERSGPDSTVVSASVDIRNKLVGVMSILLTLFRSNVCWAKPNHAFFYCQHSFAIFFHPPSLRAMSAPANRPRAGVPVQPRSALAQQRFRKSTSFPLFLSRALARLPEHFVRTAAKPMRRHGLPPVRQLKIFIQRLHFRRRMSRNAQTYRAPGASCMQPRAPTAASIACTDG